MICLLVVATSCSNDANEIKDVTSEFENTTWKTGKNSIYLRFDYNEVAINVEVTPETEPSDLNENLDNFNSDKYIIGYHKNVTVEKHGKDTIKIFNDEDLDLEFEMISDNEMKDSNENILKKK